MGVVQSRMMDIIHRASVRLDRTLVVLHNENMEIREYPYLALYSLYCISKELDTTNDWRWTDCKLTSQKIKTVKK